MNGLAGNPVNILFSAVCTYAISDGLGTRDLSIIVMIKAFRHFCQFSGIFDTQYLGSRVD